MSDTIQLKVITHLGQVFDTPVNFFKVFSETGELGVFPGHTPTLALLSNTDVHFEKDGKNEAFYVSKGYIAIQEDSATITTDTYLLPAEIDSQTQTDRIEKNAVLYSQSTDVNEKQLAREQRLIAEAKYRVSIV